MTNEIDDNLVQMEFTIELDDTLVLAFIQDSRIKACGRKTDCSIELTNRILNKPAGQGRLVKYCIVRINGRDEMSIRKCLKMIERIFPEFLSRREYNKKAPLTIYTKEFLPENADVYYIPQKTGACRSVYGDIPLKTPFATSVQRPLGKTPWKITTDERMGHYDPTRLLDALAYYKPSLGMLGSRNLSKHEFAGANREVLGSTYDNSFSDPDEESGSANSRKWLDDENKDDQNGKFGKLMNSKGLTFMTQRMLDNIPKDLNEPLVIMLDGEDIFLVGSAAVKMQKNNFDNGNVSVDICSAAYKVKIEGDALMKKTIRENPANINVMI